MWCAQTSPSRVSMVLMRTVFLEWTSGERWCWDSGLVSERIHSNISYNILHYVIESYKLCSSCTAKFKDTGSSLALLNMVACLAHRGGSHEANCGAGKTLKGVKSKLVSNRWHEWITAVLSTSFLITAHSFHFSIRKVAWEEVRAEMKCRFLIHQWMG